MLPSFIFSYLRYVNKTYLSSITSSKHIINSDISKRIYETPYSAHDTTDISKKYAKKMEKLTPVRDGSDSTKSKVVINLGYLIEGSCLWYRNRLTPLILNLFSTIEEDFKSEKEKTKDNLHLLDRADILSKCLHLFDRGYDDISFMVFCIKELMIRFIIRATSKRLVCTIDDFKEGISECKTQKDKTLLFYPLPILAKTLTFRKHSDYPLYSFAWKTVYLKGPSFPKNSSDLVQVNVLFMRFNGNKDIGIEEDFKCFENELYFYTTEDIDSINDAVFIFLSYLNRWKIEMFFRFIKQIFNIEKICILAFEKIVTLIGILPIACNYSYDLYADYFIQKEKSFTQNLKMIHKKGQRKRSEKTILLEMLYFSFIHFCEIKNLTHTPDAYAKFLKDLMMSDIQYTKHIMAWGYQDSS